MIEDSSLGIPQCRCVWLGERCPNDATQEDGLCDWCAPLGARTTRQLMANPKACISPQGEYTGLGGAGELHDYPFAGLHPDAPATACWYANSERVLS